MSNIKTKESLNNKTIRVLDKSTVITEKTKDSLVNIKNKTNISDNKEQNEIEYGSNKIKQSSEYLSNKMVDCSNRGIKNIKNKFIKMKNREQLLSIKQKSKLKNIKQKKNTVKNTAKSSKTVIKSSQNVIKMVQQTTKVTVKTLKIVIKGTISTVKGIIEGTKTLVSAIIAGGWIAVVVILIICMVGLLCNSIYGIFLLSEKTSSNSITMKDVVNECNQEFAKKIQEIQNQNTYEEYVLEGTMASWKDIIIIYVIKQSNGVNEKEVITIDNNKKNMIKSIFWDMNNISFEVKNELVTEQGITVQEAPKKVQKTVLHIRINSKTLEQVKSQSNFNLAQINQLEELSNNKYSILWNGVIYGNSNTADYIHWRQRDASWSNIKIGNTNSTISDIGCLVTSIAILIKKSGISTNINPFNPGTFVEELNKNGGFNEYGELQYSAINRIFPNFQYKGKINLRGKSKNEKLAIISQYFNQGYYITIEVKGATLGNQHWVAITEINGDDITMVDPGSDQTNMWNAYEYSKTSQFNYFKVS